MGIKVMVIETFEKPVLKSAKIRRCPKKSPCKIFTKNKNNFFGTWLFSTFKSKNVIFVQECAAELPFLSPVKIIFLKFSFVLQILSPIWLCAILCAHAILCAPTVLKAQRYAVLLCFFRWKIITFILFYWKKPYSSPSK